MHRNLEPGRRFCFLYYFEQTPVILGVLKNHLWFGAFSGEATASEKQVKRLRNFDAIKVG